MKMKYLIVHSSESDSENNQVPTRYSTIITDEPKTLEDLMPECEEHKPPPRRTPSGRYRYTLSRIICLRSGKLLWVNAAHVRKRNCRKWSGRYQFDGK